MKVKNISGSDLDVPVLNTVVPAGAVVDVPEVQADGQSPLVWPPETWQPVAGNAKPKGDE